MSEISKRIVNFSVVYWFVILIFGKVVLGIKVEQIGNRIEQLLSIVYLCLYPLYYFAILYASKRERKNTYKKDEYYIMQFPDINSLNRVSDTGFWYFIKRIAVIIIWMICSILFICRDALLIIFVEIHNKIWKDDTLITIIGVVVAIYAFLFAFLPIIVEKLNNKCMFFKPYDLPVIKWSNKITTISLIELLVYILVFIINKKDWLLGAFEVVWFLLIGANVIMYVWAFIMPMRIERRVINKIHLLYKRKRIYMTPNKKWFKSDFIRQISKLIDHYEKILHNINYENIENIEFDCVLSKKKENIDIAVKRYYFLVGIAFGIMFLFGVLFPGTLDLSQRRTYLLLTLLSLMPLLCPLTDKNIFINNYRFINRMGFLSIWGYYIKLFNKEKRMYITFYDYSVSAYRKYLVRLKRIVCFYNLAINMKYDDVEFIDGIAIECLCAYVSDITRRNIYKKGMLVPVLICGCLSENQRTENWKNIKEMIKKVNIDKKEQEMSIKISLLMLRDMYGNDANFNTTGFERELYDLFS